jgi:hypothetical protein
MMELAVISVDITCGLMDEDETGCVSTFLREACGPALTEPGAVAVPGDRDAPAVGKVLDILGKAPEGRMAVQRLAA